MKAQSGFKVLAVSAALLGGLCGSQGVGATAVVYDFESFSDSEALNQIAGLSFAHTTALAAGASLNEFEFPPHSGSNVVTDDGGAISIDFAAPVFSVGGYFTYVSGLSFRAYDSANFLLGTVASTFTSNVVSSANAPNELLSFADAGGRIARVEFMGDPLGGSFVLDDLTVDAGTNRVPEPQTLALVIGLLGAGCVPGGWLRRRRKG
jgi:hypothetical protein